MTRPIHGLSSQLIPSLARIRGGASNAAGGSLDRGGEKKGTEKQKGGTRKGIGLRKTRRVGERGVKDKEGETIGVRVKVGSTGWDRGGGQYLPRVSSQRLGGRDIWQRSDLAY